MRKGPKRSDLVEILAGTSLPPNTWNCQGAVRSPARLISVDSLTTFNDEEIDPHRPDCRQLSHGCALYVDAGGGWLFCTAANRLRADPLVRLWKIPALPYG